MTCPLWAVGEGHGRANRYEARSAHLNRYHAVAAHLGHVKNLVGRHLLNALHGDLVLLHVLLWLVHVLHLLLATRLLLHDLLLHVLHLQLLETTALCILLLKS